MITNVRILDAALVSSSDTKCLGDIESTIDEIEELVLDEEWAAVKQAAHRLKYFQSIDDAAKEAEQDIMRKSRHKV